MNQKITISSLNKIAAERGGFCLSDKYINTKINLKWKCSKGHIWEARADSIKAGSWCKKCSYTKKSNSIEEVNNLAKSRNGQCLTKVYINNKTPLKWECSKGHTWNAPYDRIKLGAWCPKCAGKVKPTIEEMYEIAKDRNGKCLSTFISSAKSKLKWECSKGHIWVATSDKIKNKDSWCPKCAGKELLTIEEMHELAKSKNGECLSSKYKDANTKLKWKCSEGHVWQARPSHIKNRNSWCPKCHFYLHEELCRTTFEQIFDEQFIKVKPDWLINSRGNKMELDGYCKKLKIAFEYQGKQHFEVNKFTDSTKKLNQRIEDDSLKKKLCGINNVTLICINHDDKIYDIPKKIRETLNIFNHKVLKINFEQNIDYNKIYFHKTNILNLQEIASKRNGMLLSNIYLGKTKKLTWKCSKGHTWDAEPYRVLKGSWCGRCAGTGKLSIEEMHELAKSKNGKCLSTDYKGGEFKLTWQCSKGHKWTAVPSSIRNSGTWCPKCAVSSRKKLTIEEMNKIAKERSGECLSKQYINNKTKLNWKCKEGHIWEATPKMVKMGRWCPSCSKMIKR